MLRECNPAVQFKWKLWLRSLWLLLFLTSVFSPLCLTVLCHWLVVLRNGKLWKFCVTVGISVLHIVRYSAFLHGICVRYQQYCIEYWNGFYTSPSLSRLGVVWFGLWMFQLSGSFFSTHTRYWFYNGINTSYNRVLRIFFWPGLKADISRYCKTCHTCQVVGKPNQVVPPFVLFRL